MSYLSDEDRKIANKFASIEKTTGSSDPRDSNFFKFGDLWKDIFG
jgi:hypothetical protein